MTDGMMLCGKCGAESRRAAKSSDRLCAACAGTEDVTPEAVVASSSAVGITDLEQARRMGAAILDMGEVQEVRQVYVNGNEVNHINLRYECMPSERRLERLEREFDMLVGHAELPLDDSVLLEKYVDLCGRFIKHLLCFPESTLKLRPIIERAAEELKNDGDAQ